MIKTQACLLSALLISGVALAQESTKESAEDSSQAQKTEKQGSQANDKASTEATSQAQKAEKQKPQDNGEGMDEGMSEGMDEGMEEGMEEKKAAGGSIASETFMTKQSADQIRSDQLVGSDIVNAADDKIGSISDLIMDKDGQVVGIIVGVGGFLGMGEKQVALSWDSVEITTGEDNDNYQVMTPVEKEDLEDATEYREEDEPENQTQAQ